MKKIVISGYYGYDNLGDEAVLETILTNIRAKLGNVEITVLSSNPSKTSEKYGVKSAYRAKLGPVIKAIKNADVLISGGGSLLQDVTSRLSIFYYLGIIAIAKLCGTKVMVYSQGIGPINKPINQAITKHILNKVDAITVREKHSKQDLKDIGIVREVIVTADPVISMSVAHAPNGHEILKSNGAQYDQKKPSIGFAFRGKYINDQLVDRVENLVRKLSHNIDANFVFIPYFHDEDVNVNYAVAKKLGELGIYVDKRLDCGEMLGVTDQMDVLVGVRLHSLIYAAICNVPMVAISYDPKINYFMETLGLEAEFDIDSFNVDKLVCKIKEVLENKESYSKKLDDKVSELKTLLEQNETILQRLIS